MKHTLKVTLILMSLFFIAEIVGLFTINQYIRPEVRDDGSIGIMHPDTIVGEQPDIPEDERSLNFIPIIIAVLFGTALLFVLIRFRLGKVWKAWFMFAVTISLAISFDVYLQAWLALALAVFFAILRTFKHNAVIHNFTEVFIYTGITILILPWLNLVSGTLLLVLISVYDMIAVWKSKHMIKLAKFQLNSKMFAGLSMNYKQPSDKDPSSESVQKKKDNGRDKKEGKIANAILGGGDIAFPLVFAAAVMEHLIVVRAVPQIDAFFLSLLVTLGSGVALLLLLLYSKKDRFYPAMPFISAGCFLGFGMILLLV